MKAIMYHFIREFEPNLSGLKFLHFNDFCKQLDYLQKEFGFVDKCEFLNAIKNKNNCPNGVILTFDDGLKDHFRYVFPELVRRNLWGIFYVSSGPYDQKIVLSVHKIQYLLAKYGGKVVYENIKRNKHILPDPSSSLSQIHDSKVYQGLNNSFEENEVKKYLNYNLTPRQKDLACTLLFELFGESEVELNEQFYLSRKEIKEMNREGMIIGGHGVNHHPMSNLSIDKSKEEIENSLSFIEELIDDNPIKTFCYPHGTPHTFSKADIKILESNTVDFSFAVESRDILDNDLSKNIHSLPRYDCNEFNYGKVYNARSLI